MVQGKSRFLCILLYCACAAFSQSDRGVITGTVSDATAAVVPDAEVTAIHVLTNTSYRTTTTASGDFTVPSLPVGDYTLRVEKQGFKVHLREKVILAAAGVSRVDVQLELGTTQQTVEVTSTLQMLQSETARLQSQVASRLVEELPLVVGGTMRSPFDLAAITPDVTISGTAVTIAGGTAGHYGITLDGVSAATGQDIRPDWVQINTPSVDAITEFAVDSGAPKAETGHATGGSITFVSKSGTNQFHGTAYEFLRNDALDARSFFEAKKRVYKQHDFGVTAGGPVWIPKLYNGRDKTFFFFSYEGFRNRVGDEPSPSSVPPPEFFTGDLRNWVDRNDKLIQIYNPRTTRQEGGKAVRDPFANNQIPTSLFDPASKLMMQFGSAATPNVPGLVPGTSAYVRNNYVPFGGVALTPFDKYSIKVDHYLSGAHRLAFYFGRTTKNDVCGAAGCTGLPGVLSGFQTGFRTSDVYRMSWDYTLSPRILNRFYAGGNNWREDHWSIAQDTGRWKDKICIKNVEDCDENLPQITFSEFSTWVGPATNGSDNIVVDFNNDMTFISGPHTFKWGYAYDNNHYNGKGEQNIAGTFGFNRLLTSVPGDTVEATGGGSGFAAFLLGEAYNGGTDTRRFVGREYRYHAGFFQDDWRVNSRLTLNLGVRYEVHLAPLDGKDEMSDLDPKLPNPAADGIPGAMIFAGFGPGRINSRTMTPTWYAGIGPRVGLAYSLNRRTVLRSSFTRSFGPVHGGPRHADGFTQQWSITSTNQGLTRTFKLEDGLPPWPHPPFIDPSVSNGSSAEWYAGREASLLPENLDWIFSLQRQIGGSMVAEAAYHGVSGVHLRGNPIDYNAINVSTLPAILSPYTVAGRSLLNASITSSAAMAAGLRKPFSAFTSSVTQSLRPFPQYTSVDTEARGGHSTYHALTLKLEKRYSSGLTFQGSYVLSKVLTDLGGGLLDHFNRGLEKSIAGYDRTHNVKLSYVYELPFGAGRKWLNAGLLSQALGGWRVSGIHTYSSGTPMSLGTTFSFPTGTGGNRPTITTYEGWRAPVVGDQFDPFVDRFLQPASFFGTQPTDRKGNMTRNNPKLRNFPEYNENISLAKTFNLTEVLRLDFRWEAFNQFNRVRFGALSGGTSLQSNNFGLWRTQSNDPRRMQVALKLYW